MMMNTQTVTMMAMSIDVQYQVQPKQQTINLHPIPLHPITLHPLHRPLALDMTLATAATAAAIVPLPMTQPMQCKVHFPPN